VLLRRVREQHLYKSFTLIDMHESALHSTETGHGDPWALVNHTFAQIWELRVTNKYSQKKNKIVINGQRYLSQHCEALTGTWLKTIVIRRWPGGLGRSLPACMRV